MSFETAPKKPMKGEPCVGCGFCCAAELCGCAKLIFGHDATAPCPLLVFRDGRFWCALVVTEKEKGLEPMVATTLGVGTGCRADAE